MIIHYGNTLRHCLIHLSLPFFVLLHGILKLHTRSLIVGLSCQLILDLLQVGRFRKHIYFGFIVSLSLFVVHLIQTHQWLRAKAFLNDYSRMQGKVRLILVSLRHVEFVELSPEFIMSSEVLPLVFNTSAKQCSPGFRALTHVLSSSCWKESLAYRERWGVNLPPEIIDMMLRALRPRDILSLCQSSLVAERW